MKCTLFFALIIFALAYSASAKSNKKIVCYYGSWATYRQENGKCQVEDLDPTVCTHMIYTFVGISDDGDIKILDAYNDLPDNWGKDGFGRFNKLRERNPEMKTLIAIGGWNEGSERYSNVVNDPVKRAKFVNNAAEFTIKYGFDGFDLDWEYPNQRGGKESDVKAYSTLLKEMRARFDKDGLLLSAAVASAESSASLSYEIVELGKYLDFINVMSYDLHGSWEPFTGFNSPLYPRKDEEGLQRKLNVNESIHYWISQGAPKEKIIMGIPLYGRTFTLADQNNYGPGAKTYGAGVGGPYTRTRGFLGFNEMCELQTPDWKEYWDDEQKVPYVVKGTDWVGFDNERSVKIKTEYINSLGLGGAMVWSLETDDFRGLCGKKYPLLNVIKDTLGVDFPPATTIKTTQGTTTTSDPTAPTTTPTPSTTISTPAPPTTPTTERPPFRECKEAGYFRDPKDCSKFYECVPSGDSFQTFEFHCGDGQYFDEDRKVCDYKENVNCKVYDF